MMQTLIMRSHLLISPSSARVSLHVLASQNSQYHPKLSPELPPQLHLNTSNTTLPIQWYQPHRNQARTRVAERRGYEKGKLISNNRDHENLQTRSSELGRKKSQKNRKKDNLVEWIESQERRKDLIGKGGTRDEQGVELNNSGYR